MSEPKSAPTVLAIVLGRRLAALRDAAGLTAAQAAKHLRIVATTITRMEKAETSLKYATVKTLLEIYGVSQAEIEEFLSLLDKASTPGWWQSFRDVLPTWFGVHVSLETAATHIRSYEPAVPLAYCRRRNTLAPCWSVDCPTYLPMSSSAGWLCAPHARNSSRAQTRSLPSCGRCWTRPSSVAQRAART